MKRRTFLASAALAALAPLARAQGLREALLYKNPDCGCCAEYAKYLRGHGFAVKETATHDLDLIKSKHGVPGPLGGCHTTLVGGYVVEGHVPVGAIEKLLRERPPVRGISLPGMPLGSPGMSGRKEGPFTVLEFGRRGAPAPQVYFVE